MSPTDNSATQVDGIGSLESAGAPSHISNACVAAEGSPQRFTFEMEPVVQRDRRASPEAIAARQAGRVAAKLDGGMSESAFHNPQKFANSPNELQANLAAYDSNPDKLFNSKDANLAIISEKPEHRAIVYMKAQMLSNTEIAQRTGYSIPWISQITRQPWFRQQLLHELKIAGTDNLSATFQASALDSIYTLIEVRDNDTAPANARLAAANSILDRVLGKPVQHVETKNQTIPTSDEITKLNKDIAESEAQLKTYETKI